MDSTIEYLIQTVFPSPFNFFQQFGTFWDENGWSRIGHQLEDLFSRLQQFLVTKGFDETNIAIGLMKYDYLHNQKYKPRKPWWEHSQKHERNMIYDKIMSQPEQLGSDFLSLQLTDKELRKHTMLEELPFDLKSYLDSGKIVQQPSIMLTYFDPSGKGSTIFPVN